VGLRLQEHSNVDLESPHPHRVTSPVALGTSGEHCVCPQVQRAPVQAVAGSEASEEFGAEHIPSAESHRAGVVAGFRHPGFRAAGMQAGQHEEVDWGHGSGHVVVVSEDQVSAGGFSQAHGTRRCAS
jgi:hypothetical protein